jgi:hypothetical protein
MAHISAMVQVIVEGENVNGSIQFFWIFSKTAVTFRNGSWAHFSSVDIFFFQTDIGPGPVTFGSHS